MARDRFLSLTVGPDVMALAVPEEMSNQSFGAHFLNLVSSLCIAHQCVYTVKVVG